MTGIPIARSLGIFRNKRRSRRVPRNIKSMVSAMTNLVVSLIPAPIMETGRKVIGLPPESIGKHHHLTLKPSKIN